MKLKLFLWIFVAVLFSVIVSAQSVCCEKIGDEFCVDFSSPGSCFTGFDEDINRDFQSYTATCSQAGGGVCNVECCVESDGACSDGKPRIECKAGGGNSFAGGCDTLRQCAPKGGCILGANECNFVNRARCEALGEERGVEAFFDPSILTANDCRALVLDVERGCCVQGEGQCTMGTLVETQCDIGNFREGVGCTEAPLRGLCETCVEEDLCRNNNVYRGSSCGWEELKEECDGINTICGEDINGDAACVPLTCNSGKDFFVRDYDVYEGVTETITKRVDNRLLGGENKRFHGESWCMVANNNGELLPIIGDDDPTLPENSAGTRHYVLSCIRGRVVESGCGEFRDSVCQQSVVNVPKIGDFTEANCLDNRYERCFECGKGGGNVCDETECHTLGGGTGNSDQKRRSSHCEFIEEKDNILGPFECYPKYPPGIKFYEGGSSLGRPASEEVCDVCGASNLDFNQCTEDECHQLGDCRLDDGFLGLSGPEGILYGAIVGGVAGWAIPTVWPDAKVVAESAGGAGAGGGSSLLSQAGGMGKNAFGVALARVASEGLVDGLKNGKDPDFTKDDFSEGQWQQLQEADAERARRRDQETGSPSGQYPGATF